MIHCLVTCMHARSRTSSRPAWSERQRLPSSSQQYPHDISSHTQPSHCIDSPWRMSLLHALVSHGSTILAESHGSKADDPEAGNAFSHATNTILAKVGDQSFLLPFRVQPPARTHGLSAAAPVNAAQAVRTSPKRLMSSIGRAGIRSESCLRDVSCCAFAHLCLHSSVVRRSRQMTASYLTRRTSISFTTSGKSHFTFRLLTYC